MNRNKKFTLIFTLLAMAACSQEKNEKPAVPENVDFSVRTDAALPVADWKNGDLIDIFGDGNKACTFKVVETEGKTARISGTILKTDVYAFLNPSLSKYNGYDGLMTFTARLESAQEAVENASSPAYAVSAGFFMDDDGGFTMTPIVSYVKVKGSFGGHKIESLEFQSSDNYVAGTVRIKVENGNASITRNGGFKSVVLKKTDGFLKENTDYVFALLPGSYKDAKLLIRDDTGKYQEKSVGDMNLNSGSVTRIPDIRLDSGDWEDFDAPGTYAAGTVAWSDGSPAEGISVSDGFNVAVTDASGKYKVRTSSDTRYIYFSYPENAKITVKNGCPQFFTVYDNKKTEYDFTLARQDIEKEFVLFALADPQAHYSARGSQKKADTDRFRDESVPAINSQIAGQSLPCYGVTLGDIVYSEGNRDSNPGMTKMRDHFGLINMPVFQVMGNHDYTYFSSSRPLKTDEGSSELNLKAQRIFEETFGPVNFSFNRGDIHIVCMKNVQYDSPTDAGDYHCGYTDAQWKWLQADLANVPKTKAVILCGHIPLAGNASKEHVMDVLNLVSQYPDSRVFSGHTHYYRGYPNTDGSGMYEHIHSAVCGQWWWSNMEGDGCPNGYTVYYMKDRTIRDAFFTGVNENMNTRDFQMRIYRGNLVNGGKYAYFKWMQNASTLYINVFNGDSRWKVTVYENDVESGSATLMPNSKKTYSSVTAGNTYEIPASSNQDWWAIGYHIGVVGRGRTSTSYYTNMFHMWKYTLKNPDAKVKVVATDPYGNKYTCSDIVESNSWYPSYIRAF